MIQLSRFISSTHKKEQSHPVSSYTFTYLCLLSPSMQAMFQEQGQQEWDFGFFIRGVFFACELINHP